MSRILLSILLAIAAVGANAQYEEYNEPKSIDLTRDERQLVQKNNDFAFRLMRETRKEKENQSLMLSPLSITYALGMLNNGADGQTQKEINDVLGFGEAGAEGINRLCRKLLTEAPTLDEETRIDIANTIFVNSGLGYELQPAFVEKANAFYDAQPESRDFSDGKTRDVINQWGSDHTQGISVPCAAAALGAQVLEKHFTLDRNMEGPDHKASLEPAELKAMVKAVREIETALGDGNKQPTALELENAKVARKSIVAGRAIRKGETFTKENLTVKRPGTGISPMAWDSVLGQKAVRDFEEDELICL